MLQYQSLFHFGDGVMLRLLDTTGKRVERLRKDRGWNQEELARRANVRQNYISQIENDKATPTADVIASIARALNTSADFLLMLSDIPTVASDALPTYYSTESEETAKLIDTLPPEIRQLCLDAVQRLSNEHKLRLADRRRMAELLDSIEIDCGPEARQRVERYLAGRIDGSM